MPAAIKGTSEAEDAPVSMALHLFDGMEIVLALCKDLNLRIWSCQVCVYIVHVQHVYAPPPHPCYLFLFLVFTCEYESGSERERERKRERERMKERERYNMYCCGRLIL